MRERDSASESSVATLPADGPCSSRCSSGSAALPAVPAPDVESTAGRIWPDSIMSYVCSATAIMRARRSLSLPKRARQTSKNTTRVVRAMTASTRVVMVRVSDSDGVLSDWRVPGDSATGVSCRERQGAGAEGWAAASTAGRRRCASRGSHLERAVEERHVVRQADRVHGVDGREVADDEVDERRAGRGGPVHLTHDRQRLGCRLCINEALLDDRREGARCLQMKGRVTSAQRR